MTDKPETLITVDVFAALYCQEKGSTAQSIASRNVTITPFVQWIKRQGDLRYTVAAWREALERFGNLPA